MENHTLSLSELSREERIKLRKQNTGSRHNRRLKKYSDSFLEIFNFFLSSYRKGILDFCGSVVKVEYKEEGSDCLFGFRQYDNGVFSTVDIIQSSHPNMLRGVIIGKKAWGLWCSEWSDGICEGLFTKEEILSQFEEKKIKIPESLMIELDNRIRQKKIIFWEKMVEDYQKNK